MVNKSILNKNKGQQIDCIVNTMIMAVMIVNFLQMCFMNSVQTTSRLIHHCINLFLIKVVNFSHQLGNFQVWI